MGLMQRALETYDALAPKYAGVYIEGQVPLAPIAHLTKRIDIEISIDLDGNFQSAKMLDKDDQIMIIPSTEMAENRTSKAIAPYPLCDKLEYMYEKESIKYQKYVQQLEAWMDFDASNQILKAILKYIRMGSIIQDLFKCSLIKLDENQKPEKDNMKISWSVIGSEPNRCSRNTCLFDSYIRFYRENHFFLDEKNQPLSLSDREEDNCMITGKRLPVALSHGKSIVPAYGNAKLISSNDKDGYTFRGRFVDADQALSISYEASQKIHNTLRWLVSKESVSFGKRVFLCWNPQGIQLPKVNSDFSFGNAAPVVVLSDYRNNLKKVLMGYKKNITDDSKAIIVCFDGTSDNAGRLSVVYYNELQASDFLDRLYEWNEGCCWINGKFGIQSPPLNKIVSYAFGNLRKETVKGKEMAEFICDDKIMRQQMQRLLACRLERARIPEDIERALVIRCSNLMLYDYQVLNANKKGSNINLIEDLLFTTCAVVRKYRMEQKKEEWELNLEPHKRDKSYQYGRLLAVMEAAERVTYEPDEKREPNATRLQSSFVRRPFNTTRIINERLNDAYFPKMESAEREEYAKLIEDIMFEIFDIPGNNNAPLEDTYLMGYYLQKRVLRAKAWYKSSKEKKNEEEEK